MLHLNLWRLEAVCDTHGRVELSRSVQIMIVRGQTSDRDDDVSVFSVMLYSWKPAYASFSCRACSGLNMPRVVQTSMPIPRTSRTIVRIFSKPRFRPARSRQAAPMQNRVLPFSFALRAASSTGSISTRREAFVAVVYREDCEQYEPVNAGSKIPAHQDMMLVPRSEYTHNPLNIRQLRCPRRDEPNKSDSS